MKIRIWVSEGGKTYEGETVLSIVSHLRGSTDDHEKQAARAPLTKPSGAVDNLYAKGFFGTGRTLGETLAQLGNDGFNFSSPSVLMALQSRSFLQRRGTKGSYRFVQKYPSKST